MRRHLSHASILAALFCWVAACMQPVPTRSAYESYRVTLTEKRMAGYATASAVFAGIAAVAWRRA